MAAIVAGSSRLRDEREAGCRWVRVREHMAERKREGAATRRGGGCL